VNALSGLPRPCLALVTDRSLVRGRLEMAVSEAVAGGVNLVQLREKDLPTGELLALAKRIRVRTQGRALLFVNDRRCGTGLQADGVWGGWATSEEAHRLAGLALSVGRSRPP
jgi:thiamine-phosphate pyrophosphorylase